MAEKNKIYKKHLEKWSPKSKYGGKKIGMKNVDRAVTEMNREYDTTGKHNLKKFSKKVSKAYRQAGVIPKKKNR
jgi:hypothetical protein